MWLCGCGVETLRLSCNISVDVEVISTRALSTLQYQFFYFLIFLSLV